VFLCNFLCTGDVIQDYDADKKFPVYGFGAKPSTDELVNQYFPINYNEDNPACDGIEGVLKAYHEALGKGECVSSL